MEYKVASSMIHNYISATKSLCWARTHVHTSTSCLLRYSVANVLGPSYKAAVSWDGNDQNWNNTNWSHHLGKLVIKYQLLADKFVNAASLPVLMPTSPCPNHAPPDPHNTDQ